MKKPGIIILILLLAAVIVAVFVFDLRSTRTESKKGNKFNLEIEAYSKVDPEIIAYKEVRNYNLGSDSLSAFTLKGQKIYLAEGSFIRILDLNGKQLSKFGLPYPPTCLEISGDDKIIAGFSDRIGLFDETGAMMWMTDAINERAYITGIAGKGALIFAADAGNRVVRRFDDSGKFLGSFEGKTGENDSIGFIVPSGYFDLKVNREGELWIVNPGRHSLENYTDIGDLRGYWERRTPEIEGFSGCCNPAHLAFLPDGSFVTSEKLIVRIKVHKISGELASVVAIPDQFQENGIAPDLAVDESGNIYALDFDRKTIRVFSLK